MSRPSSVKIGYDGVAKWTKPLEVFRPERLQALELFRVVVCQQCS